jgi:hypothetical protein
VAEPVEQAAGEYGADEGYGGDDTDDDDDEDSEERDN